MAKDTLRNFIPISRKLFEHRFWSEERVYSKFEAWIDLIQFARFEDEKRDFGSKVVIVKRGQCVASSRFLSNRWGWSRTKVETFLKLLEDDKMIQKSHQKDIGQTIVTICNYSQYNKVVNAEKPPKEPVQSQHEATAEPNINIDNKENIDNTPYNPPKGYEDYDFSFMEISFAECMTRWLDYKRSKNQKYKSQLSLEVFYKRMIENSGGQPDTVNLMIEQSMGNNWDGLFPLKEKKGGSSETKQANRQPDYSQPM